LLTVECSEFRLRLGLLGQARGQFHNFSLVVDSGRKPKRQEASDYWKEHKGGQSYNDEHDEKLVSVEMILWTIGENADRDLANPQGLRVNYHEGKNEHFPLGGRLHTLGQITKKETYRGET
jgi:hypothetical protein